MDIRHIRGLDGLRGLAVLLVILFHADVAGISRGFIGVDIFFVLSGFLITGIMLREHNTTGQISLRRFYMRRILRLGPALILILLVYVIALFIADRCGIIPYANPWPVARREIFASLFYVANWYRALEYSPPMYLFSHTWSLSIEEQFYMLWPVCFLLMLKCFRRRVFQCGLIAAVIAGCWHYRAQSLYEGATINRIYHGFDTRSDAILVGCLVAMLVHTDLWRRLVANFHFRIIAIAGAFAGMATLIISATVVQPSTWFFYTWGLVLIELATAFVILGNLVAYPHWIARINMLHWAPIVWLGQISYGLYLWHYPIFRLILDSGHHGPIVIATGFPLTLLFASLSFYYVERPFLKLKVAYASAGRVT